MLQNIRPPPSPGFRRCNSMFSSMSAINTGFHEWSVDEVSRQLCEVKGIFHFGKIGNKIFQFNHLPFKIII